MTAAVRISRLRRVGRLGEVIDRVARDPNFARALRTDPRVALEPFELDGDELRELARWLEESNKRPAGLDDLFE